MDHLRDIADHENLTLLTATHDVDHSQAAVLAKWLSNAVKSKPNKSYRVDDRHTRIR